MNDADQPKTSETIFKPEKYVSRAEREEARIRLQGEQSDEELALPVNARPRRTQDWTPFYHGLVREASKSAAIEGGSSMDQLAIEQMLVAPDPDNPRDPDYVPSPEALAMIEEHDQAIAEAQAADAAAKAHPEDPEAQLLAREKALDAREADIKARELTDREKRLADREKALDVREAASKPRPKVADTDGLRAFRPAEEEGGWTPGPSSGDMAAFSGRKRMTAEERVRAEQEGMELFGIDPTAGSAWSKLGETPGPSTPGPRHARRGPSDEEERILRLAQARERAGQATDADEYAQALADQVVAEDDAGEDEYEKRQREAQAQVDAFLKDRSRHW